MHTSLLISLELCIFSVIISICAGDDYRYEACVPTNCSSGPNISFPFYLPTQESYCGYPGFMISCRDDGFPILQLSENDFVVEDIFYDSRSLRVYNSAVLTPGCFSRISNTTLPDKFRYASLANISLFSGCKNNIAEELSRYQFSCGGENRSLALYDGNRDRSLALEECEEHVVAPVELKGDEGGNEVVGVGEILRRGFVMNWLASNCSDCEESGGRCGFNVTSLHFRCFCPDRPHSRSCKPGKKSDLSI